MKALKAVVKALNVKFEIKHERIATHDTPSKKELMNNIKQGFKELKLIQKGKMKATPAKDFINELKSKSCR